MRVTHWIPLIDVPVCASIQTPAKGKHARAIALGDSVSIYAGDVTCKECKMTRYWLDNHVRWMRLAENLCVFCKDEHTHYWFERGRCNS